jgi:hypothetical protein
MNIGISCHASAGGSGVLATELAIALADRGHQVHIVSDEAPFRLSGFRTNLYSHGVDTISYPLFRTPPYTLALANKISEVVREHNIDVWHAHYAIPFAIASLLARGHNLGWERPHFLPHYQAFDGAQLRGYRRVGLAVRGDHA